MEVFCVDISGVVLSIPRRISYTPVETVAPTCALPLVASHALIEIEVGVDSTGSKIVFYLGDQEGNRFYLEMPRDVARELGMSMMAAAVGPPDMEAGQIGYEAYRLEAEGRSLATGVALPKWEVISQRIRIAWGRAAATILNQFAVKESKTL